MDVTNMNYLIAVDRPHRDDSVIVEVRDAEDEKHARLAAYYHIYGVAKIPDYDLIREMTTLEKSGGICVAKFYTNIFEDVK
ncbi:hypothetical protein C4565_00800 [Candidatus Parcubacteria bacterium]|nr:MAG: hypothetical protein C4565_00800 [Candidatus Parcubacteria bacterium]